MNRISEQIIEELQFDIAADSVSRGIIGLCSDASAGLFYAYDQNSIFQVCFVVGLLVYNDSKTVEQFSLLSSAFTSHFRLWLYTLGFCD